LLMSGKYNSTVDENLVKLLYLALQS
jgi:hypothetical protein